MNTFSNFVKLNLVTSNMIGPTVSRVLVFDQYYINGSVIYKKIVKKCLLYCSVFDCQDVQNIKIPLCRLIKFDSHF